MKELKDIQNYTELTEYLMKLWKDKLKWKEKIIKKRYKEILGKEIESLENSKQLEYFIKSRPNLLLEELWLKKPLEKVKQNIIVKIIKTSNDKEEFLQNIENSKILKEYYHTNWWENKEIQNSFNDKFWNEIKETKNIAIQNVKETKDETIQKIKEKKEIVNQKIEETKQRILNRIETVKQHEISKKIGKWWNSMTNMFYVDKINYDWTKNTIIWDILIKTILVIIIFTIVLSKISIIDTDVKKLNTKNISNNL